MSQNAELSMTLEDAVAEVLTLLIGSDVRFMPEMDRFQTITRFLNMGMRSAALDHEWKYFYSHATVGHAHEGTQALLLRSSLRPRMMDDDAVVLVKPGTSDIVKWAYFQNATALHKYRHMDGLWCSVHNRVLQFSRPFTKSEEGLEIQMPSMREPVMFRLPEQPTDPAEEVVTVPRDVLEQQIDFDYPDYIIRKAAWLYAQTDPVLQPRVQTLEAQWKDLMYALTERDTRSTDTPYQNPWNIGIDGGIYSSGPSSTHPHAGALRLDF